MALEVSVIKSDLWSIHGALALTGEEDIEVIANDLIMELRGRIDSGADFGMVGGGCEMTGDSESGNWFVEA